VAVAVVPRTNTVGIEIGMTHAVLGVATPQGWVAVAGWLWLGWLWLLWLWQ
jgi:hypothetical protein